MSEVTARWIPVSGGGANRVYQRVEVRHPFSNARKKHSHTVIQPCMRFLHDCTGWALYCLAHGELAWLFHEPHTGLDDCLNMLLACFRKRMSGRGVLHAARPGHDGRGGLVARRKQPLRLRAVRRQHSHRSGRRRLHPEGIRQT